MAGCAHEEVRFVGLETSGFQSAVYAIRNVDLRGYREERVIRRRLPGSLGRHAASSARNVFLSAVCLSLSDTKCSTAAERAKRVVASESGVADSRESLKALAIVVRSFALHETHGHADYD